MPGEIYGASLTPNISTGNPETVNDAVALNPLGTLYKWKGNIYRYVKFTTGGVAAIAKGPVYWIDLNPAAGTYTVVADQSDSASVNMVAGVIHLVATNDYYVWIQVGGFVTAAKVTASKAIGSKITGGTVDCVFSTISTATTPATLATAYLRSFGVMVTASTTAATANVLLENLDW